MKASCTLSQGLGKPEMPPSCRSVGKRSARPVSIYGRSTDAPRQNEAVARRVEHAVDGDGQLHHAEVRGEVPAGARDLRDKKAAQLVAKKRKLRAVERPEVFRRMNSVQDQRSIPLQLFSGGPAGARDTAVMSNHGHYRPSCGNIQDIQRDIHRKIFVNDAKQGGVPKVSALPGVTCSAFPCCARARRGSPLLRRTD